MNAEVDDRLKSPEPLAAGQPVRSRAMFLGLLGAVFLSGGVVGGGVGMLFTQEQFKNCLRYPERMPERILNMFRSELGLSDEQAEKVGEIVRRHHEQIEAVRAEVHPRMSAEFNAIHAEVSAVLNERQRLKWDELRERLRRDFPPPKRERKQHDEAKQPSTS